jgi:hypothetical protein
MKKEELAKAIFEEENRLRELNGERPVDLESPQMKGKIRDCAKRTKYDLEGELERLQRRYADQKLRKEHDAKVAAYYATPEGAAFKAETERAMERKIEEWKEFDTATTEILEQTIQAVLGKDWGVDRYKKGYVEVGVIDAEKSTPEMRRFYFGQYIEIRCEERYWSDNREIFEANCGSCGSFGMEGGATVVERAMFYAGIGRLFGDPGSVAALKAILKDASQKTDLFGKEYNDLRRSLANPLPEPEK